jgi:hypothetical protein
MKRNMNKQRSTLEEIYFLNISLKRKILNYWELSIFSGGEELF